MQVPCGVYCRCQRETGNVYGQCWNRKGADVLEKMDIYNATKKVPDNAKKRINGGRLSGKTDINPMWRIKILTEQFVPCGIGWYYKTVNKWMETYLQRKKKAVSMCLMISFTCNESVETPACITPLGL